ncbi:hypothetical protein KC19_6G194800 [Ceratodon purpureus]|uniref:Uncharacterized protein n=1 Tax=Ceratodon purpureus TaxID=3225 RepID=A0A8T0HJB7_CERPU|nr:hypothetical protein KC19_6G194800 [Ceratodon purpureus]
MHQMLKSVKGIQLVFFVPFLHFCFIILLFYFLTFFVFFNYYYYYYYYDYDFVENIESFLVTANLGRAEQDSFLDMRACLGFMSSLFHVGLCLVGIMFFWCVGKYDF